jgi:hypothetical protein
MRSTEAGPSPAAAVIEAGKANLQAADGGGPPRSQSLQAPSIALVMVAATVAGSET